MREEEASGWEAATKRTQRGALVVANASDVPEFPIDLVERFAALELIDHALIPKLTQSDLPATAGVAAGGIRSRHAGGA
jgi:hypothetical protein